MPDQQQKPESAPVAHTKSSIYDLFYASKARKTYTNLGISLILIIIFLVFALVPTIQTIDTVQEKITEYKSLNTAISTKVQNAKNLEKQRATSGSSGLKDEITFLNKTFLYDYNLLPIFDNMFKRAELNNIKITSISPKANLTSTVDSSNLDTIKNPTSTTSYQVAVSMEAKTMSDAIAFVKTLESYKEMPVFLRVKTVSVADQAESAKVTALDSQQTTENQTTTSNTVVITVTFFVYLDQTRYQAK